MVRACLSPNSSDSNPNSFSLLFQLQEACFKEMIFAKAPLAADVNDYVPAKYWTKTSPPVRNELGSRRVNFMLDAHGFLTALSYSCSTA